MGAYGSPELPTAAPTSLPAAHPRSRARGAGVRALRALRRTVVVILCVLGAMAALGGVLQLTGHVPPQNTAAVGR